MPENLRSHEDPVIRALETIEKRVLLLSQRQETVFNEVDGKQERILQLLQYLVRSMPSTNGIAQSELVSDQSGINKGSYDVERGFYKVDFQLGLSRQQSIGALAENDVKLPPQGTRDVDLVISCDPLSLENMQHPTSENAALTHRFEIEDVASPSAFASDHKPKRDAAMAVESAARFLQSRLKQQEARAKYLAARIAKDDKSYFHHKISALGHQRSETLEAVAAGRTSNVSFEDRHAGVSNHFVSSFQLIRQHRGNFGINSADGTPSHSMSQMSTFLRADNPTTTTPHVVETCKVLHLQNPRYQNGGKTDLSAYERFRRYGKAFMAKCFGIIDPDVRLGIEGSKLIHPTSLFHHVQLSFWEKYDAECLSPPTLHFDMFADIFFCTEVLLHFFVAVEINGRYIDDIQEVFSIYVLSGRQFWFDAFTSFPFSWIEWVVLQNCQKDNTTKTGLSSVTSLLRVFKMLRFVKILNLHGLLDELLSTQPTVLRFVVLVFSLFISTHLATCLYWKILSSLSPEEDVTSYLEEVNVDESSTAQLYIFCSYLVFSFLSTVGYTEIQGTNASERCYCIALMVFGVCMFATVLTEVQRLINAMSASDRELEEHLTSVITFFRDYRVPRSLERSVKQWTQLRFMNEKAELARQAIIKDLPEELSLALAVCLDSELFSKVSLFSKIQGNITKVRFIAQLVLHLKSTFFRAHHVLASQSTPANRLVIITSGRVNLCVNPPKSAGTGGPTGVQPIKVFGMKKGDSFGTCSILGDPRWAGEFGIDAEFISAEEGSIAFIYTSDILNLLAREEFKEIRDQLGAYTYDPEYHDADTGCSVIRTFHWIRIGKKLLSNISTARWKFAISKTQENLASEELVEQALTRTMTTYSPPTEGSSSNRGSLLPEPTAELCHGLNDRSADVGGGGDARARV